MKLLELGIKKKLNLKKLLMWGLIMSYFEGYINHLGAVIVCKVPDWARTIVDKNDPHVIKYLGMKQLPSLNQAKKYFIQQNGGRQYVDISKLKKE